MAFCNRTLKAIGSPVEKEVSDDLRRFVRDAIYDGRFSTNLWCLYCFVFFGAVNLVKIMGPEGNYIDLLMVHQENIYNLLREPDITIVRSARLFIRHVLLTQKSASLEIT